MKQGNISNKILKCTQTVIESELYETFQDLIICIGHWNIGICMWVYIQYTCTANTKVFSYNYVLLHSTENLNLN